MFFEQVNYDARFLSLRTILRTNSWLACSIYWVERSAGRVTGETEGATGSNPHDPLTWMSAGSRRVANVL